MRAPKFLAIIGLATFMLGLVLAIMPTYAWTPKSEKLVEDVATVSPEMDYWPLALAPYIPEESRNITLNGTVSELGGRTFDLYVFNKVNYERWKAKNASYEVVLQEKNVSSHAFEFSTTREDLVEGLRFVVLNIYAEEPAQESWIDDLITVYDWMDYYYMPHTYPYVNLELLPLRVEGAAEELNGQKFNLIVLDDENFRIWEVGESYKALYEAREVTACPFSFDLAPENFTGSINTIVKRVEPGTDLNVRISANISYMRPIDITVQYRISVKWEEKSYAQVFGGHLLGGGVLAVGLILMISAVFLKPKPERKEVKAKEVGGIRFCPNCGEKVSRPDARFCEYCGQRLEYESWI